jgi:hypothetical protein
MIQPIRGCVWRGGLQRDGTGQPGSMSETEDDPFIGSRSWDRPRFFSSALRAPCKIARMFAAFPVSSMLAARRT